MSVHKEFPIIGVGASAGGVEALEGFFRGLPDKPGIGIVVVTHLSPDRDSLLHEIIRRYTQLDVKVAVDNQPVEVDTVYVLPCNAPISIEKRQLRIAGNTGRRERKPIDIFLASLAVDLGERSVGIILSGGDGDGALGIKAIKERGGLTMAQTSNGFGPQHPDMPQSAIATGFVDFALPVEEMGAKLADFASGGGVFNLAGDGTAATECDLELVMPEICDILRSQIGHDFSGYKKKTFMRRVQRRMQVTQLTTVDGYIERLRRDPQEVGALFRDLLINVTNFFRDADAFETLAKTVIPKLFEGRGADETVRVWVPGCATGEEVFSIGMLMREHMDTLTAIPRVQIFATDIDERALSVARAARYPAALLDGVSEARRTRFFIPDGGSYVVSKDVRDLCIFSPHSVIRDPPFSRIDLVSCRNLLIYFGVDIQNQVIPTFHYALRRDGYLFLGSAENVSQFDELFQSIEKKHRIFRRRSDVAPSVRLPVLVNALRPGQVGELTPRRMPLGGLALRQAVDEHVLERFAPPHVVVNRDGDVVYYSSRTGKYLETPAGAPTRQLLTLAKKGLRLDLRTAFRETLETGQAIVREAIAVEADDGRVQMVSITVEQIPDRGAGEALYLVLFTDQGPVLTREEALNRAHATRDGAAAHMERELRETRDRLQSMIEEYETALEELKSSNEELVSVNEEMQSTNEELEASKEEMQSVNEELHTVNTELSGKVDLLDRANSDLRNLFESTDMATVFLDEDLVIRVFTPAVARIFNILPGDRGRPITDLSSRASLEGFAADIAGVFANGKPIEKRVESADGTAHYLVRVAPYRDAGNRTRGVVVTFIDVTNITEAERRQGLLIAELQHRTRNLLAVVQSIARQTLDQGEATEAFSRRLAALSRVQSLASSTATGEVDLGDIIRRELEAVGGAVADKIAISGPTVQLGVDLIQSFGLALHELSTNAAQHGALKYDPGQLEIDWDVGRTQNGEAHLSFHWRETGVTTMPEAPGKGFGRELIERALKYTLRAHTDFTFGPEGISCLIQLPLEEQKPVIPSIAPAE